MFAPLRPGSPVEVCRDCGLASLPLSSVLPRLGLAALPARQLKGPVPLRSRRRCHSGNQERGHFAFHSLRRTRRAPGHQRALFPPELGSLDGAVEPLSWGQQGPAGPPDGGASPGPQRRQEASRAAAESGRRLLGSRPRMQCRIGAGGVRWALAPQAPPRGREWPRRGPSPPPRPPPP